MSVFQTISLYFSDVFKNPGSLMLSIVKYCWYFANNLSNIMYDIMNVLKLGILMLFMEIFIVTNYEYKKKYGAVWRKF